MKKRRRKKKKERRKKLRNMRGLSITLEDGRVYFAWVIVVKWSAHLE